MVEGKVETLLPNHSESQDRTAVGNASRARWQAKSLRIHWKSPKIHWKNPVISCLYVGLLALGQLGSSML